MTDTKSDYLQDAIRDAYNLHRKKHKAGDTARLSCAFCECEEQARASSLETFLNSTEFFMFLAKALHRSRFGGGLVWDIDRSIKYTPYVRGAVRANREKALSEARKIRNSILKGLYGYKKARELRGDKLGRD